jgi:hypothetical protein
MLNPDALVFTAQMRIAPAAARSSETVRPTAS